MIPFLEDLGTPLGFANVVADTPEAKRALLRERLRYIQQLELPIYYNFTKYAYHDILQKLALKVTVLEFVKKEREARLVKKEKDKDEEEKNVEDIF